MMKEEETWNTKMELWRRPVTDLRTAHTYRHDLLQVVQGGGCHADEGVLVTWCSRWSQELPVREDVCLFTQRVSGQIRSC